MSNSYISYLRAINNSLIRDGIHLPIDIKDDMSVSEVESVLSVLEPFCYFNDVLSKCGSAYTVNVNDCKAKTYTDVLKEEVVEKYKDKFDMALDLLYSNDSNIGNKKVSSNTLQDYLSKYGKTLDVESLAKIAKSSDASADKHCDSNNLSYNSMFSLGDMVESKFDDYSEQEDEEYNYDENFNEESEDVKKESSDVVYDDYDTEETDTNDDFDYSDDSLNDEENNKDSSSGDSSEIVYDNYDEESNKEKSSDLDEDENEEFDYSDDEMGSEDEEFDYSDDSLDDDGSEGIKDSKSTSNSQSEIPENDDDDIVSYSDEDTSTDANTEDEDIDYSEDDLITDDNDEEFDYSDDNVDSEDEEIDYSDDSVDSDDDEVDYSDDDADITDEEDLDYSLNDLDLDSSNVFSTPTYTQVSTPVKPKEKEDYEKTADKIVSIVGYGEKLATRMANKFKGYTNDKK